MDRCVDRFAGALANIAGNRHVAVDGALLEELVRDVPTMTDAERSTFEASSSSLLETPADYYANWLSTPAQRRSLGLGDVPPEVLPQVRLVAVWVKADGVVDTERTLAIRSSLGLSTLLRLSGAPVVLPSVVPRSGDVEVAFVLDDGSITEHLATVPATTFATANGYDVVVTQHPDGSITAAVIALTDADVATRMGRTWRTYPRYAGSTKRKSAIAEDEPSAPRGVCRVSC